ncbi:MAG: PIG-L family deacetylase [Firmicutes bacterium]|nr:PIG-L family deacetylase [Bacillota bacterium]MDH7494578.1 PIG-L family deacetylase [Bacillota bacterium]
MDLKDFVRVPRLDSAKRVLCVQPHPDDNEIGAGGTIAWLTDLGVEVVYLTVTDGCIGTQDPGVDPEALAERRRAEAERSARHLGVSRLVWLGYHDADVPEERELTTAILGVIRSVRPDVVLAPDPWLAYEAHRDHRLTGMATASACMFSGLPHATSEPPAPPHEVPAVGFYCTPKPNTWINVDRTWVKKMEAMNMHESQFSDGWMTFCMYLDMKARELARGRGFARAEAFKVVPTLLLHFNVDTEGY